MESQTKLKTIFRLVFGDISKIDSLLIDYSESLDIEEAKIKSLKKMLEDNEDQDEIELIEQGIDTNNLYIDWMRNTVKFMKMVKGNIKDTEKDL